MYDCAMISFGIVYCIDRSRTYARTSSTRYMSLHNILAQGLHGFHAIDNVENNPKAFRYTERMLGFGLKRHDVATRSTRGAASDKTYLENLFKMRPAGVVSKKLIGDLKIANAIRSCSLREAWDGEAEPC